MDICIIFWSGFIILDLLLESVWAEIFSSSLRNKGLLGDSVVKNLPANAGDVRDASSIPGSQPSPGEGKGNWLQYYYCLGNPMDREACWATIHGVT